MNRGTVGTGRLNEALQETRWFVAAGKSVWAIRSQIRNNYDQDVYNGDIGLVTDINTEDQAVHVDIDGNDIVCDYAELDELVLAYAVSIHKSQGSEYPAVVIPVMTQHYVMLQRNLIYTGITRGKKLVVLVGTKKALGMAVRNNRIMQRNSWLWGRLRGGA